MKNIKIQSFTFFIAMAFLMSSCEEFVEVELPDHKVTSATVFASDANAESAMTGVYNQLFNTSFANGGNRSVSFLSGLSGDNFRVTSNVFEINEFWQNNISATNSWNFDLWAGAYNMVYMTNAILEGINNSNDLTEETSKRLEGEAKFVRAFTYFYLTNLYGDVPLLLETNYKENAIAPRTLQTMVYEQIITDLVTAVDLLEENYSEEDRTRPNRYAAMALLARVYLYLEDWQQAEYYSSQVISQASLYWLLENPDQVFLANSREAIWQISPVGWGSSFTHTREGNLFIYDETMGTPVVLSTDFMNMWNDLEDLRLLHWTESYMNDNGEELYYPFKYKIQYDDAGGEISEYSMVLRLAEQYLIRAEARARMGDLAPAISDVDSVRERAGISLLSATQPNLTQEQLLDIILKERRKELFTEWGHRWLNLRRFGLSAELEDKMQVDWQVTDWLYPIPEEERKKNTSLSQNPGY